MKEIEDKKEREKGTVLQENVGVCVGGCCCLFGLLGVFYVILREWFIFAIIVCNSQENSPEIIVNRIEGKR